MKTTDWKYDFASLPRWDNRDKFLYVYDEFYEIPQSDTLVCLYSITEVSMLNYVGFLAILKGKENPSLFVNVTNDYNFCVNFSVSVDGNLIFLQPSIYREGRGYERPILVIDLKNNCFSYVLAGNYNPCYEMKQLSEKVFVVEAHKSQKEETSMKKLDGREIRIDELQWYELDEIHTLSDMILGKSN